MSAADQAVPRQVHIRYRWNADRVLFSFDVPQDVASGMEMRAALEAAVAAETDLSGAVLSGAVLSGADLSGAVLSGAGSPRATPEESIAALDKVAAIILDDADRLEMGHWHGGSDWLGRTCAEEAVCGTTHCLAGWLQVCSTDPKIRAMDSHTAGILSAPVASKMFFRNADTVLTWLKDRKYVDDLAQQAVRDAARAARKAAQS